MSSSQEQRVAARAEEGDEAHEQLARAEAHAREAAREIAHEHTERARVVGEAEHRGGGGGILESVQQSARSFLGAVGRTLGVARDTTADKAREAGDVTAQKAGETAEATKNKLGEYKDYAADKAVGLKDVTAEKATETAEATKAKLGEYRDEMAKEAKDSAAEKASQTAGAKLGEYSDLAAEKAKDASRETKDAAAAMAAEATDGAKRELGKTTMAAGTATEKSPEEEKLDEYEQSAADAARKAMEYLTLRTQEVKEKSGASKAGVDATEELARQEVDATRQGAEVVAEAERRWKEHE